MNTKEAFEEARAAASTAASSSCLPNQMSRENSSNISFMFAGLICEGSHQRLSILICFQLLVAAAKTNTNYVVAEKGKHREFSMLLHVTACDLFSLHFFTQTKSPPNLWFWKDLSKHQVLSSGTYAWGSCGPLRSCGW